MVDYKGEKRWTVREVAEMLGRDVHAVYRWIAQGKVTYIEIGGIWHIRESELDQYLGADKIAKPPPLSRTAAAREGKAAGERLRAFILSSRKAHKGKKTERNEQEAPQNGAASSSGVSL